MQTRDSVGGFAERLCPAQATKGSFEPALLSQGFIPVLRTPWWLCFLHLSLSQHLCSCVLPAIGVFLLVLTEVYLVPVFIALFWTANLI